MNNRKLLEILKVIKSKVQEKEKPSIVVDNEHATIYIREQLIWLAQKLCIKSIRCLFFNVKKELCKQQNMLRPKSYRLPGEAERVETYLHMS